MTIKPITLSQIYFNMFKDSVGKERAQEIIEDIRRDIMLIKEERRFLLDLKYDKSNLH